MLSAILFQADVVLAYWSFFPQHNARHYLRAGMFKLNDAVVRVRCMPWLA